MAYDPYDIAYEPPLKTPIRCRSLLESPPEPGPTPTARYKLVCRTDAEALYEFVHASHEWVPPREQA